MEHVRYQPLVTLLRRMITGALYVEVGAAAVVIFMFIMTIGSQEDRLLSAWPVEVDEHPSSSTLTTPNKHLDDLAMVVDRGTIQFSSDSTGYYLLKLADAIFVFAVAIGITLLLRRIFRALHDQHPFTTANAHRVRGIALLVLLITPYSLIKSLVYRYYITQYVVVEGKEYADWSTLFSRELSAHQVWLDVHVDIQALLIGLVVLVIAEVFRVGVLIQQDNESIV